MDSIAKLSLYDILTMLVSGFLILALFIPVPKEEQTSLIKDYWYLLLVLSYIKRKSLYRAYFGLSPLLRTNLAGSPAIIFSRLILRYFDYFVATSVQSLAVFFKMIDFCLWRVANPYCPLR